LRLFKQQGISVGRIHQYVQQLQQSFLAKLAEAKHAKLHAGCLLTNSLECHGHFLTFRCGNPAEVAELAAMLKRHGIETDYRGDRLRFGFALYHNSEQYDLSCLK